MGEAGRSRRAVRALVLASSVALVGVGSHQSAWGATVTSTFTDTGGDHIWSDAANWNPAVEPNDGDGGNNYVVTIPAAPGALTLDTNVTIDGFTLAPSGVLNIGANNSLTFSAAATTVTDNGEIIVNSNQVGYSTFINFNGTASHQLTGSGTIDLNDSTNLAQLDTGTGSTLTQASTHSIVGQGQINAALTNNGIVNANVNSGLLTLQSDNVTNNLTFEATGGGTLSFNAITVTQGAAGVITAATGSAVTLENATISGGTLTSSGTGNVSVSGNSTATISNVTNSGTFFVPANNTLNVTGNLANTGIITVNENQVGYSTVIDFSGGTLSGGGSIVLDEHDNLAQLNGVLTQAAGSTISGFGDINATLTNKGTVNANVSTDTLIVQGATSTNTSLMEATNGGLLTLSGVSLTNTGGTVEANGGNVELVNGASITGGVLTSVSPNVIYLPETTSASIASTTLTTGSELDIYANSTLTANTITNNGLIVVNKDQVGYSTSIDFTGAGAQTLNGSGTIKLNFSTNLAQLNTGTGTTLTQAATHSIVGQGQINAALTNNGVVNSNVSGGTLTLQADAMTNNLTFEATGGGTLAINAIMVTQGASGNISADATSAVGLDNGATISGGTLTTTGAGSFSISGTDTINSVTSNANIDVVAENTLNVTGNLVNNGAIAIDPTNVGYTTVLNFGGSIVSGTGSIALGSNTAQLNGTLTEGASNTITGFGTINAALTNNGVVDANVSGQTLTLQTNNMTNNLTFEATGGATLAINAISVTQGASGKISADATSAVTLENGTAISGGTLSTTGAGSFSVIGTDTISGVTSNASIDVVANNTLNVTGNLVNTGSIAVDPNGVGYTTVLNFSGGNVSGGGAITLGSTTAVLSGTLTQAAGDTISGYGYITAALTNNGIVDANAGQTLNLQTSNMTNNLTFEATSGSTMTLNAITLTQGASGKISADATSAVILENNAMITGGALSTAGAGYFSISGVDTISSVTSTATIDILANNTLNISGAITDNGTISVNTNVVGYATALNAAAGTVVSGTGSIILNDSNSLAQLNGALTQGAGHTIIGDGQINAALINNGLVESSVGGQTLYINHSITGTGTLDVVANATAAFAVDTGGSVQGALTIASTGSVDLANNHLIINYGTNPDPAATILGYLKTGYAGGAWNGVGLRSSSANQNSAYALGYADGKDGVVSGLSSGQIEVKYTLYGDVNLDGAVNGTDFAILAGHFGKNVTGGWDQGDLTYAGKVNATDFSLLASNFGKSDSGAAIALPASEWAALDSFAAANGLLADVPEPASLTLLGCVAAGVLVRRRRNLRD